MWSHSHVRRVLQTSKSAVTYLGQWTKIRHKPMRKAPALFNSTGAFYCSLYQYVKVGLGLRDRWNESMKNTDNFKVYFLVLRQQCIYYLVLSFKFVMILLTIYFFAGDIEGRRASQEYTIPTKHSSYCNGGRFIGVNFFVSRRDGFPPGRSVATSNEISEEEHPKNTRYGCWMNVSPQILMFLQL